MSGPTVLVTGAGGTVGGDVLRLLREDPEAGFDLVLTDADPDEEADPPVRGLDVRDLDATTGALQGVDTVIHLAGASSPEASWEEVLDLNVVGTGRSSRRRTGRACAGSCWPRPTT